MENLKSLFVPKIQDPRMVHFATAAFGSAFGSFVAGRYFTHLTAGQSLGYGASGLFASTFFALFHPVAAIAGPPTVEFLGEGVVSASMNLREIVVVVAAAYVGMVLALHALNLATWTYNTYGPNGDQK